MRWFIGSLPLLAFQYISRSEAPNKKLLEANLSMSRAKFIGSIGGTIFSKNLCGGNKMYFSYSASSVILFKTTIAFLVSDRLPNRNEVPVSYPCNQVFLWRCFLVEKKSTVRCSLAANSRLLQNWNKMVVLKSFSQLTFVHYWRINHLFWSNLIKFSPNLLRQFWTSGFSSLGWTCDVTFDVVLSRLTIKSLKRCRPY